MGLNAESLVSANDNPFQFLAQNVFNLNDIITLMLAGLGRVVVVGVTLAFLTAYLERPGEPVTTAEVWQRFIARFVKLLISTLIYDLAVILATLLAGGLLAFSSEVRRGGKECGCSYRARLSPVY